jgi:hypothetical protein
MKWQNKLYKFMSIISSVSSTASPDLVANQNAPVQFVKDFNAIGTALQSGNLSSAQSALSRFQQDLPSSIHPPFGGNGRANTDYLRMTSDLQSGDLLGAQRAFTNLQNDLQEAGVAQTHKDNRQPGGSSAPLPAMRANGAATISGADNEGGNDGSVLNATA